MSVIVKGLSLENKYLDGYMDIRLHYRDGNIYATIPTGEHPYYKRLEVVELPDKHGALIDKDEFKETLDYYIREAGWSDEHNEALAWVKDDFIDAELIIVEAEDSE